MKPIKLMLFSGFLGSGKTTTMVAMAEYLREKGIKVSVITNDLGENLVDTNYAKMKGIQVQEIANGCLCHDVDHFVKIIEKLVKEEKPDIIFAEPVGSCVDLVRSVYGEINHRYKNLIQLLPFTCVIDPQRYRSIYMNETENLFDAKATYMYRKQLEDGDILLLNKCDLITKEEKREIIESLKKEFKKAVILPVCAVTKEQYNMFSEAFLNGQKPSLRELDMDWDYVMNSDAHMGWYNNVITLFSDKKQDFQCIIKDLMGSIQTGFGDSEIAHLKIMGYEGSDFLKTALTSTKQEITFSHMLQETHKELSCNINIRALQTPEKIAGIIHEALEEVREKYQLNQSEAKEQAFESSKPAPVPALL